MRKTITLFLGIVLLSCGESETHKQRESESARTMADDTYEFHSAENNQGPLLILFPDLGGNAQSTKESFSVLPVAKEANVSVLLMNFNHHLFLSEANNAFLTRVLEDAIKRENLNPNRIVIGGFSSGGIVSVLWSNNLLETNHRWQPNKVFAVDSPLDLVALFKNVTDVDSTSHDISLAEAEYITEYFEKALDAKDSLIQRIAEVSPFDYSTLNFDNIRQLREVDFRLYTEADSMWWKENRGFEFEETDSYQVIRFATIAKTKGWNRLQLIQTTNKGYRANGQRHPHAWSIVDPKELMEWVVK